MNHNHEILFDYWYVILSVQIGEAAWNKWIISKVRDFNRINSWFLKIFVLLFIVLCWSESEKMAGKGDGEGEGNTLKLEGQITLIKYVILFTNVLTWVSKFKDILIVMEKNIN